MERITKRDLDELDFKILSADNSDIKKYKEELDKISNLIRIRINYIESVEKEDKEKTDLDDNNDTQ